VLAQVEVAGVVGLEGGRAAVAGEGVGLDDELLGAPEKVDFPAAELGVYLGGGDAAAAKEGGEGALEV
jgi:hypothetical protein